MKDGERRRNNAKDGKKIILFIEKTKERQCNNVCCPVCCRCRDGVIKRQMVHMNGTRVYFKRRVQPKCGVQDKKCGVQNSILHQEISYLKP